MGGGQGSVWSTIPSRIEQSIYVYYCVNNNLILKKTFKVSFI